MKKSLKKSSLSIVVLLVFAVILAACSANKDASQAKQSPQTTENKASNAQTATQAPTQVPETPKKKLKIGFANLTEALPFTVQVREGIEAEAKKNGIELVIANNNYDGATALSNVENFITQHVDGVIEYQTDAEFGNVIMQKLRTANIPVIAIDIPMPGATFFGADNYKAGQLAGTGLGKAIQDKWQGKVDKLVLLELPQSGPLPAARMQGIREGMEAINGKISDNNVIHLDSKGDLETTFKLVNDVLQRIPKGSKIAFGAITDDAALGAAKALDAAGRAGDALIVSQNGDQNIQKEILRPGTPVVGSTGYFPTKYGSYLIPAMMKLLNKETIPPAIYVDHAFLTKDNLNQYYPEKK